MIWWSGCKFGCFFARPSHQQRRVCVRCHDSQYTTNEIHIAVSHSDHLLERLQCLMRKYAGDNFNLASTTPVPSSAIPTPIQSVLSLVENKSTMLVRPGTTPKQLETTPNNIHRTSYSPVCDLTRRSFRSASLMISSPCKFVS